MRFIKISFRIYTILIGKGEIFSKKLCLFGELFRILMTSDWLTQQSSQSETSKIQKSLPKRQKYDLTSFLKIPRL